MFTHTQSWRYPIQFYRGSVHVNQHVYRDPILQGIPVHVNQHVYNFTGDPSTC